MRKMISNPACYDAMQCSGGTNLALIFKYMYYKCIINARFKSRYNSSLESQHKARFKQKILNLFLNLPWQVEPSYGGEDCEN